MSNYVIIIVGDDMSRMDRYYEKHEDEIKRTSKNSKLYDDLYSNKEYENVENLNLNVGKEININEVKDILEKRERYNELKDYRIVKPEEPVMRRVRYYEENEPNSHDINEMIGKAKVDRPYEEKKRSLEETQVMTLEELIHQKSYAKKGKIDKADMEDLLNTIYDTNLLKEDDGELFDNLKSTGKTIVVPSIKQVLDDAKESLKDEEEMDNSFFTSSLGLKDKEIKKVSEDDDLEESNNSTMEFLIALGVVFVIVVIFILIKFVIL